jgi:hypothetical protein
MDKVKDMAGMQKYYLKKQLDRPGLDEPAGGQGKSRNDYEKKKQGGRSHSTQALSGGLGQNKQRYEQKKGR